MYAGKNIIILHKENQQNLPQIGKLFLKQSIGLRNLSVFDISRSRSKLKNAHDRIQDLRFLSYNIFGFKSKNEIFTLTEAVEYG